MLVLAMMLVASVVARDVEYDAARDQVLDFKARTKTPIGMLTTATGTPISYSEATNTLNTPLINNNFFMESINKLVSENIPERIVHAKGSGASGYFEVTHDVTDLCMADFLDTVGKKTPVFVRFSTTTGEKGTSDLNRDVRGFAVKFYTKDGNLDLLGLNIPVYFYKDPLNFRSLVHARRRMPATNLMGTHTAWDILSLHPESLQSFLLVYSDRSTPATYPNMPGFTIHTFQLVNKNGEICFVRFHWVPDAGVKTLNAQERKKLSNSDNDYLGWNLFRSIANGDFPSWTLNVQVLTEEDVTRLGPDVFDATKTISLTDFPLRPVGKMVLNKNPKNFFAEAEQVAFNPTTLPRGFSGAPDKLFESRRLAYRSAHIHRLGGNFDKIPVNCPFETRALTYNRNGVGPVGDNEGDAPNYYPNSFNGPVPYEDEYNVPLISIIESKPDNFKQAGDLYANDFTESERSTLVDNLVEAFATITDEVLERTIQMLTKINTDLGSRVAQGLNVTFN